MTTRDFCFWLQGWFELNQTINFKKGATPETLDMIRRHLNLVFKHDIDPSMPDPTGELQTIHDGKPPINSEIDWQLNGPFKQNPSGYAPLVRC